MPKGQIAQRVNTLQDECIELQPELLSIMKEEVEKAKNRNVPIIRAFEAIAHRSGLKANTIRNYYYRYLYVQERDRERNSSNQLESSELIGSPFTDDETEELMKTMLMEQAQGESVRGCANRLAKGDKRVLIRLQNKYRSIIAREPEYVEELMKEMTNKGIDCYNPYTKKQSRSGNQSKRNSQPKVVKNERASKENLIDILSQLMANMNKIDSMDLYGFFSGLRDLSRLATEKSVDSDSLNRAEEKLKELSNRIILAESGGEKARKEVSVLGASLRNLLNINSQFMELTDEEKLTGLNTYIRELKAYMER